MATYIKLFGNKFRLYHIYSRVIPDYIKLPNYIHNNVNCNVNNEFLYKNVKHACEIIKKLYYSLEISGILKEGSSTEDIDEFIYNECIRYAIYPSPLGYKGFPKSVCTSINNIACHGIPDSCTLINGDILSVDISIFNGNAHGDSCKSYLIGSGSPDDYLLIKAAKECLDSSVNICRSGQKFSEIGSVIAMVTEKWKCSVIPNIMGHGIGLNLHEPPQIHHCINANESEMKKGMIFTIEPCITFGSPIVGLLDDDWSIATVDGSKAAQFEHTVYVTDEGCEILT